MFDGSLSPGQRDQLEWTARHPGHADTSTVESLADVLAAQRKAEDALGSAYAVALEARGHALADDAPQTERKIGQAIELAGQLASRPGENRPWSYWYSPALQLAGICFSRDDHQSVRSRIVQDGLVGSGKQANVGDVDGIPRCSARPRL